MRNKTFCIKKKCANDWKAVADYVGKGNETSCHGVLTRIAMWRYVAEQGKRRNNWQRINLEKQESEGDMKVKVKDMDKVASVLDYVTYYSLYVCSQAVFVYIQLIADLQ